MNFLQKAAAITVFTSLVSFTPTLPSFAYNYKVTGINLITGERVLGEMKDTEKNGNLIGMILDQSFAYEVVGQWSGKGMAILVREKPPKAFKVEVVKEPAPKKSKKK